MKLKTKRQSKSKGKIETYQKDKRDILRFVQKLRKVKRMVDNSKKRKAGRKSGT